MFSPLEKTLRRSFKIEGIGSHSGVHVRGVVSPAPAGSGLVFALPGGLSIPAVHASLASSFYATVLQSDCGTAQVSTVEHLLAALSLRGISNARICLEGSEVPIYDGSALPFVQLIEAAGTRSQARGRVQALVRHPVEVRTEWGWLRVEPASHLSISMTCRLSPSWEQTATFDVVEDIVDVYVSCARTFVRLKDVEAMRGAGLIKGGSLDNALVLKEDSVVNPEGLRSENECAQHKILDFIGDLVLLGGPLCAKVTGYQSGHGLHHALMTKMLEEEAVIFVPVVTPLRAATQRVATLQHASL